MNNQHPTLWTDQNGVQFTRSNPDAPWVRLQQPPFEVRAPVFCGMYYSDVLKQLPGIRDMLHAQQTAGGNPHNRSTMSGLHLPPPHGHFSSSAPVPRYIPQLEEPPHQVQIILSFVLHDTTELSFI